MGIIITACSPIKSDSDAPPTVFMQTIEGTATRSYPVGVFNVNQKLLGTAIDNDSYAAMWNIDASDSALGVLIPTTTSLGFDFKPKSGQVAPTTVIGMRFFQFDFSWNALDTMSFPQDSIVDFGDGVIQRFDGVASVDMSLTQYRAPFIGVQETYLANSAYSAPGSNFTLNNYVYSYYKTYADYTLKTITIFHCDNDYFLYDDNRFTLPANGNDLLSNLRGNLPHGTKGAMFTGTEQQNYNTFKYINYAELKENLQYFELRSGGAKYFTNYNFGTLDFPNLVALGLGTTYSAFPGLLKNIIGTTDIPGKYPKLKSIEFKHSQYSSDLNLKIPNVQKFLLFNPAEASVLTATDCDRLIVNLDSVKHDTGGYIYIQGCTRTSASDTAAADLRSKGVTLFGQP